MKNLLKKFNKSTIAWINLTVWWIAPLHLYPLDTYKVTQQRANYFLVKIPLTEKITIGTRGNLYLEHQKAPVGTFKVKDVKEDECLCVIESMRPGIDNSRIRRISITHEPDRQKSNHKSPPPLIVKGVCFVRLVGNNKYYLSEPPIPLKTIEPLSVAGIKNLLYQIEEENHRYRADFIHFTQIHTLGLDKLIDFSDKNKIYLGTADGKLSVIYQENSVFQYTQISSSTLKKFRNDIFFHVMLETKER